MKQTPLVSIIIPTYNRAHLIGETLDSVLAQTYKNWECIVVDDGSTDGTAKLLAEYCKNDSRFQYHHRPINRPKGANACRNYGFELSKGEYVNWLDDDDFFSSNKLELQIDCIISKEGEITTCSWGRFKNNRKDFILKKDLAFYRDYNRAIDLFNSFSEMNSYLPSHCYLIKKEVIFKSGLWDETLLINQDGEFFCRVLLNVGFIFFVPECFVGYRFTNQLNTSSFNCKEKYISAMRSWELINSHIFNKFGLKDIPYVQKSKSNLLKRIKKEYPELADTYFKNIKDNNFISIILPVYNGEKYLSEAIESCLNQTYKNFELIIVNDCSTDNSLSIAQKFAKKDKRIKIITNKENKMLPATLNIGHRIAKGDYLTWISDDNILKSNFLASLVDNLEAKMVDIVYSDYDIIYNDGTLKREHIAGPTEHLLFGNKIGASFLYKKKVFEVLNGYDKNLFLLEDYDFWLRASLNFKIKHLNKNLYQYRLHENSLTNEIENDEQKSNLHKEKIKTVFEKIANELNWSNETKLHLTLLFSGEILNFDAYFNNKKLVLNDLKKYSSLNKDSEKVMNGFILSLRNQLMSNKNNFRINLLLKILKFQPEILFHKSFSKKVTFKFILKSLIPIYGSH